MSGIVALFNIGYWWLLKTTCNSMSAEAGFSVRSTSLQELTIYRKELKVGLVDFCSFRELKESLAARRSDPLSNKHMNIRS